MSHSRNPGYRAGDYWMQCEICGFHYRRSQMRQRWDEAWVCNKDFEPRHPQDMIRGREEKIAVPVARPDPVDFTNTTTLGAAASENDLTITVASASAISDEESIGIALDDTTVHWTTVNGDPVGNVVTLTAGLTGDAASGNTVYIAGDSFSAVETSTSNL